MSRIKGKNYNIEDEHIKQMSKFYDEAESIYYTNHDAFFDKSDPKYSELHSQVYGLFEKMMQVVVPDFKLPDNYNGGFPVIMLSGCGLSSFQHYIPSADFGFYITFADYTLIHESENRYERQPYGYVPIRKSKNKPKLI